MSTAEVQFALPFAERDEISVARAGDILGVSRKMIFTLIERGDIRYFRKRMGGNFYLSYASLVEFCDSLRERYAIPDCRPPRHGGVFGRWRDKDLLPFPLADTMSVPEVAEVLRYAKQTVRLLCEEGTVVAYKLAPDGFWRIDRNSVRTMLEEMMATAAG